MNTTKDQFRQALIDYDNNYRKKPEWSNWVDNQSYKYAIFNDDKIYPVKEIVSIATGHPKTDFSGGNESNKLLTGLGFRIISLRAASWIIKSGKIATKVIDKSAFTQGTGIPIEIRSFFFEEDIRAGEHRSVILSLNGKEFPAYLAIESSPTKRTRLFWTKEFIVELAKRFPVHFQYSQNGEELDGLPSAEITFNREKGFERYSISLGEGESLRKEWSDGELEETVKAYLWMLEQETAGNRYSKSDVNKKLREGKLYKRTKASIEYRMQNISSVLEAYCMPRIQGYLPAKNVGANATVRIGNILEKLGLFNSEDYKPTFDQEIFDKRVRKILKNGIIGIPKGQNVPSQSTTTTTSFVRDPLVKAWILDNAKGICEGCGGAAPFLKNDGVPFLEVHHVKTLAEGGTDTVDNTVALCPNCHRRCHVSMDKVEYAEKLSVKIKQCVNRSGKK